MISEEVLAKWEGWMEEEGCWKYVTEPGEVRQILGEVRRLQLENSVLRTTILNEVPWAGRMMLAKEKEGLGMGDRGRPIPAGEGVVVTPPKKWPDANWIPGDPQPKSVEVGRLDDPESFEPGFPGAKELERRMKILAIGPLTLKEVEVLRGFPPTVDASKKKKGKPKAKALPVDLGEGGIGRGVKGKTRRKVRLKGAADAARKKKRGDGQG